MTKEEYLYRNTELLLKSYRDVLWSIEIAAMQAEINFEIKDKLDEFLEKSYAAGADLEGTELQEQKRILEKNKTMIKMIDKSVEILRKKEKDGEVYYWILYYTYLSEQPLKTVEAIVNAVGEKSEFMAWKTYFVRRKKATEILSEILWGFNVKECPKIVKEL